MFMFMFWCPLSLGATAACKRFHLLKYAAQLRQTAVTGGGGGSLIRGTIWLAGWGQGGKGRGGTCGRPQGKGVADKWRGPLSRAPCSSHQHSCCCCCLVLRVCSPPPSTAAGVVPIIASWFISPLLAALICLAFFVVLRSLVLRRANSTRISFYVLPLLLVITVFINLFFILVRGAGGL